MFHLGETSECAHKIEFRGWRQLEPDNWPTRREQGRPGQVRAWTRSRSSRNAGPGTGQYPLFRAHAHNSRSPRALAVGPTVWCCRQSYDVHADKKKEEKRRRRSRGHNTPTPQPTSTSVLPLKERAARLSEAPLCLCHCPGYSSNSSTRRNCFVADH